MVFNTLQVKKRQNIPIINVKDLETHENRKEKKIELKYTI